MKSKLINFLPFALLGAIVATICDANHVFTGALSYPKPFLFGQAWFVFPGFMVAFTFMGLNYLFAPAIFPKTATSTVSTSSGSLSLFVENLLFFMMVYLLSGFGNQEPGLLSVILYASFLARWFFLCLNCMYKVHYSSDSIVLFFCLGRTHSPFNSTRPLVPTCSEVAAEHQKSMKV